MIRLGDTAKDSITGFTGVVVCDSQWLHGCRRLTLQPSRLSEGKPIETQTFDEPQLVSMKSKRHRSTVLTGGPKPEPRRIPAPDRH